MTPEKLEEALLDPDTLIRLATDLKQEREKRIEAQAKIETDKPKVLFADAVCASQSSILVGDLAKLLKQNGVNMGQNRLFAYLRDNGYLMKQGSSKNMPTQKSMELGLFEVKESSITNPDGSIRITKTTKSYWQRTSLLCQSVESYGIGGLGRIVQMLRNCTIRLRAWL